VYLGAASRHHPTNDNLVVSTASIISSLTANLSVPRTTVLRKYFSRAREIVRESLKTADSYRADSWKLSTTALPPSPPSLYHPELPRYLARKESFFDPRASSLTTRDSNHITWEERDSYHSDDNGSSKTEKFCLVFQT